MTTTRFPSRNGLLLGLLCLVLGFAAVFVLSLAGLSPGAASLTVIVLAAVMVVVVGRGTLAGGRPAVDDAEDETAEGERKEAA